MRYKAAPLALFLLTMPATAAVWTVSVVDADMDFLIDDVWHGYRLSVSTGGRQVLADRYGQGFTEYPIDVRYGDTIYVELESIWDNYDLEIRDDFGVVRASSNRFPTLSGPEDVASVRATLAWRLVVDVVELGALGYTLGVEINSSLFRDIGYDGREYQLQVVPGDVIRADIAVLDGEYRLALYDETGGLVVMSDSATPDDPGRLLAVVGGRDSSGCAPAAAGRADAVMAAALAALVALRMSSLRRARAQSSA